MERLDTYCVAGADGSDLPQSAISQLAPFARQVVHASDCAFANTLASEFVTHDGNPSALVWAAPPDSTERARHSTPIYGVAIDQAELVMAGFYRNPTHSADFACWVKNDTGTVLICDLIGIS